MQLTFAAGTTAAQQAVVVDAFNATYFPWSLVPTVVTVEFTTDTESLAAIHGGKAEAQTDTSGLPSTALMKVHPGLVEPGDSRFYFGERFAWETIIHELGHVVGFQVPDAYLRTIAALFAPACDFATQWAITSSWQHAGQEAFAEIFKDLWLPKSRRQYDNRTDFKIRCDQAPQFAKAIGDGLGSAGATVHNFAPQPSDSAGGATSPSGYHPTTVWAGVPIGQPLTDSHGTVIPWSTVLSYFLRVDLGMVQYATPDTPDLTPDQIVAFAPDHFNFPTFFLAAVPGVPSSRPPTLAELEAVFGTPNSADITPVTQPAGGSDETWWVHGEWSMSALPVAMPSDGWLVWGTQAYTGDQTTGFLGGVGTIPPVDFTYTLIEPAPSAIPTPRCPYGEVSLGAHGVGVLRGQPGRIHGRLARRAGSQVTGAKFPPGQPAIAPPPQTG